MKNSIFTRWRRGAQAVEFALLAPVLVAVTGGVVDYSWYFSERQTVLAAARDGARAGAIVDSEFGTSPCAVAEAQATQALSTAGLSSGSATVRATTVPLAGGDTAIQVEVELTFQPLMGLIPTPDEHVVTSVQRLEDQLNAGCGS